jgi:ATP-dependent helicase HrpA
LEVRRPPALPITARADELLATLRDHQVVVVAGETGSGKSTQLPKLCLELGRGIHGMIGHTQPRRLAARTIAERVAEELATEVGDVVGYAVRFTDRVTESTHVKVMTDGILLAELPRDPELRRYDTLIIDEAHERSLNVDFLLGYLKQLLPRRPDLKVVITSATIDTERFSEHFDDAPVIEVSGRTYPVEVRYRPVEEDQVQGILDAVAELSTEGRGDILVFLSGEREIRDTADALRAAELRHTDVLPLYARLTAAEQHRVFQPHTGRRIVLATNVAETSLTVPGIRYVIDPGTARVSRFNRRTKVQRLPIEPVSQASADQRAGRCGREAPGICIRLYSEDDYNGRPPFTEPEILRTNLASVILQMSALRLGDVEAFPFVEPPDRRAVRDGVVLLEELGALDDGRLTPLGRRLARLPLDPRLGRMVLAAAEGDCVHDVLVITSALSIQDPRERPPDARQHADELHRRFVDPSSDFTAYLNLWDHLRDERKRLSSNQFRRLCRAEHLHYLRVREWQDVYSQLLHAVREMRLRVHRERADSDTVHRALLAGLLSQVGTRAGERRDYLGSRNARFSLSSGSALSGHPPTWVMAGELVETSKLWAHVAARIRPEWIEQVGHHLVERSYTDPQWNARRGQAIAFERVTLYGLTVVDRRQVNYARIDPVHARELFIRHALVDGDWNTSHAFLAHNRELIDEVRELEERARRRDLLVGDDVIAEFYDRLLPDDVVSARHFDRWWRGVRSEQPDLLDLTLDVVRNPAAADIDPDRYPDAWRHDDLSLPLTYEFQPGSATDGVTVHVPLPALARMRGARLDWQVPGLRRELVTALVRTLPRQLRRKFVPAAEHADGFLARASPEDGPLLDVLARDLARAAGEPITPADLDVPHLPDHLRMTIRVVDESGSTLAAGKDLPALERHLQRRIRAGITSAAAAFERRGITTWDIGNLPRTVEVRWAGQSFEVFPALVDEGASVAVRAFVTIDEQQGAMWTGTRRLLLLAMPSPVRSLGKRLTNRTKIALGHAPHPSYDALLDDCVAAAVDLLMTSNGGPAWDETAFNSLRDAIAVELPDRVFGVVAVVARIVARAHDLRERLAAVTTPNVVASAADIQVQLSRLVFPGFVTDTGAAKLPDLLRYLDAIDHRLDKLATDPVKDHERARAVQHLEEQMVALPRSPERERVRWLLEELRVSLFAQQLGTAERVSEPRIRREIERLQTT